MFEKIPALRRWYPSILSEISNSMIDDMNRKPKKTRLQLGITLISSNICPRRGIDGDEKIRDRSLGNKSIKIIHGIHNK